jgi:hypothetical protein
MMIKKYDIVYDIIYDIMLQIVRHIVCIHDIVYEMQHEIVCDVVYDIAYEIVNDMFDTSSFAHFGTGLTSKLATLAVPCQGRFVQKIAVRHIRQEADKRIHQ